MGEVGGWLEAGVQSELPMVGVNFAQRALYIGRRRPVGFDLVTLPVEVRATIIVFIDMDVENENVFAKFGVPLFGDMRAKLRMTAIRDFIRGTAKGTAKQVVRAA